MSDIPQYDKKGVMVGNAPAILAHRFPSAPNLGDITRINWSNVERVFALLGGFPCQDVSHAGTRAGLGKGTRTGLWANMLEAIQTLRPRLVVAENVRGLLSARADSDMESCPWCLGDDTASPLRALGAVLGDLAEIGYDARWYSLPISDIGGCHGRFRVFIVAYPKGDPWWLSDGNGSPTGVAASGPLLPTPGANLGYNGGPQHPEAKNGNGMGMPLGIAVRLLPTPTSANATGGNLTRSGDRKHELLLNGIAHYDRFAEYAPAIASHEELTGRLAPEPTEEYKGNRLLSARFAEWMMTLPAGWVTDVPGLTRPQQMHAIGNGVAPLQAVAALRVLGNKQLWT